MSDDAPASLYKYLPPNMARLREILLDNKVWAGSPAAFNDPFDCFPHIDLTGSYAEAKSWIDRGAERQKTNMPEYDRVRLAKLIAARSLEAVMKGKSKLEHWQETLQSFRVFSLAVDPRNILMWGHYAANHQGVCLEFSTAIEPFKAVGKVNYGPDRSTYRVLDGVRTNLMAQLLLYKATAWSYEEEWRWFQFGQKPGHVEFPTHVLTGIILGAAITQECEAEIRSFILARKTAMSIRRAYLDERIFRIHITET